MIGSLIRGRRERRRMENDPVSYARSLGVQVGDDCRFLGVDGWTFGSEPYLIRIGNHVTVTGGVRFVTHDGGVWVFRDKEPALEVFGPITVGSNVFIGLNVVLMPGVTIGDNCIVGAGSVVTKDVPSGMVAVGCPARSIRPIAEYRERLGDRATFIRDLSPEAKRANLMTRFFGK
ncbi:MAG TPA: acyltransferase [Armatimonadota bacterium]|jgi:acetyltransferase-like isoleucine patch superfamily enzyme